jgi:hypothetical protein
MLKTVVRILMGVFQLSLGVEDEDKKWQQEKREGFAKRRAA